MGNTVQEHCGPNGFSPPAPPELCAQVNRVPEPSTFWLLLIGLVCAIVLRKRTW